MFTEKYCDDYYMSLIALNPVYVWGANMEKASQQLMDKLFRAYGNSKYTRAYYQNKLNEANTRSGWVSDCSGMIYPISKKDNTAKSYYANCPIRGNISDIDLSHSCLVFRGTSPTTITHIGYYCASNGEVMEMASSKANFQHKKFNKINWNYWGKPSFIDYGTKVKRPYLYKGIDVSSYQANVNYQECKGLGMDFAILKIIRKDLNKDKMFETHWKGFEQAGIPIFAVYNYSYATTVEKAKSDALKVVSYLNGRKTAICMDVEDKCQAHMGSELINIINAYQSVIEAAGLPFILYTGLSFYKSYIKPFESMLKTKNLWIARYYKGYDMMEFEEEPNQEYKPLSNIIGWQYTSSGHLQGCPGNYDFNIIYADVQSITQNSPQTQSQLSPITAKITTKGSALNVRNRPITGKIVGKLQNGAVANVVGVDPTTGWFRLSVTLEQWISPDYVKSNQYITVVAKFVNVRDSDSTKGKSLGTVKQGDKLEVFTQSTNTGWYLTNKGWISNLPNCTQRI